MHQCKISLTVTKHFCEMSHIHHLNDNMLQNETKFSKYQINLSMPMHTSNLNRLLNENNQNYALIQSRICRSNCFR